MCVVSIAWHAHPRWQLIVAGNRDEFHARSAAPLGPWPDDPSIMAGRDILSQGTWMGVSNTGRFGVVTNIRTPDSTDPQKASRGALVTDWLARGAFPDNLDNFNPFSLMIGDQQGLQYLSNRPDEVRASLGHGVHGLSNAVQGERWPRKERLNRALISWLGGSAEDPMTLFGVLGDADATQLDAHPIFIRNAVYGTRCSTILAVGRDGVGRIMERRFDKAGNGLGESAEAFNWAP
ncbi:MAG: NRDE family protein [Sphingorhabdus sp.]|uniref:NRDE family protein n=1 Tax=Sphingorhabdus sp. TaxID=1902408 RepID=UPI0025E44532|nr:NRDE family protein [Sphingorhabdus sp.]MCO4090618.1 NRDE family protein [Sphingorhabdus sp.]